MSPAASTRKRLDQVLFDNGLTESREQAKRLIMAGKVNVNGQRARKPSDAIVPEDTLEVQEPEKYVSRGGFKLEKALANFSVSAQGAIAVDLGASTGGFTDCLLQNGAKRVYAVDVGKGQLAWHLRRDHRVVVMEKTNARYLKPADLAKHFKGADIVTIDCSFISLRKILPAAFSLSRSGGRIVALIKPQFEADKAEVDRGAGVIRNPAIHARVINELEEFVYDFEGLEWRGNVKSPLQGPKGNVEFLACIEKK
jgi:23S rRNA (cytidine1920-2'-O)/16S rRNA (cytidine1409-2'-O)-methyltransferase|tara:strand:+ start:1665 stop:2426 length:762 start_codon:yes stop_codon:yes gene_type:complete